jgi:mutator family transposase
MVMSKSPSERSPTVTSTKDKPAAAAIKDPLSQSPDGLREIVRAVMQEMLEAEMIDALQAEKGERTASRLGYRSGYYSRTLVTRVGKLELRVPQDRDGRFSTELFGVLPALRTGARGNARRDVRPGRLDPQGQGDHRGVVRPKLLRLGNALVQALVDG